MPAAAAKGVLESRVDRDFSLTFWEVAHQLLSKSLGAKLLPYEPHSRLKALVAIKLLHTLVWAIMVGSILALPVTGLLERFNAAIILTVIIVSERGMLALNRGQCPLTGLAGRFTTNQADNFDIYLPNWLARHNKTIFGTLFVINELFVLWCRVR